MPPNDNEKILRQAAHNEVFDTVARAAVTDMANHIRNNRISRAEQENKVFGNRRFGAQPHPVVIAAKPDTARHPLPCGGDRQALKTGWCELARSNHPDAVAVLEVAVGHDPELLEFGAVTEVPVQPGTITERWARRLAPCDPSAAHAVLAHGDAVDAFFTDPLTGMPALRTAGDGGSPVWRFYAPLSLPPYGPWGCGPYGPGGCAGGGGMILTLLHPVDSATPRPNRAMRAVLLHRAPWRCPRGGLP
ncbi:hypothetical protein [Streptomyces sp. NPDC051994]|uniref:hypothetical protein n=1 Tax=unclassified Streptomyces TaxID=2593676 RepID=UPI00341D843E